GRPRMHPGRRRRRRRGRRQVARDPRRGTDRGATRRPEPHRQPGPGASGVVTTPDCRVRSGVGRAHAAPLGAGACPTPRPEGPRLSRDVLAAFALCVLPVTRTPGTSATLITQSVTRGGGRHGAAVIGGSLSGLVLHATFATLGLSALIMASATALTFVR